MLLQQTAQKNISHIYISMKSLDPIPKNRSLMISMKKQALSRNDLPVFLNFLHTVGNLKNHMKYGIFQQTTTATTMQ